MADPAEDIPHLYERHAAAWAHLRGQTKFNEKPWIDKFAARVPAGGAIVDIGCGSGEPIAKYLAQSGFQVTGVDASQSLIALCRERMPEQSWQVADMRMLSLEACFKGVLAWHSFFHLTPVDQRAMFPVFRRHCAPGGVLMFTGGDREGVAMGVFEGDPLFHGSLEPAEYAALLEREGFELVEHTIEDFQTGGSAIWLAVSR